MPRGKVCKLAARAGGVKPTAAHDDANDNDDNVDVDVACGLVTGVSSGYDPPVEIDTRDFASGELLTSDRRVTQEELDAFLKSDPDEYTIESLLQFVAQSRRPER